MTNKIPMTPEGHARLTAELKRLKSAKATVKVVVTAWNAGGSSAASAARGETLAVVGDTESMNGPKLYFELRSNGRPTDPEHYEVGERLPSPLREPLDLVDYLAGVGKIVKAELAGRSIREERAATEFMQLEQTLASGNAHSVAAGRISYFLGLQGPALASGRGRKDVHDVAAGELRRRVLGDVEHRLVGDLQRQPQQQRCFATAGLPEEDAVAVATHLLFQRSEDVLREPVGDRHGEALDEQ